MQLAIAYVVAAVVFGGLDALWLGWAGPNLYRPALGDLLAPTFRLAPAGIFYLAYLAGMVWFAIRPGIAAGLPAAALNGALLGALCYATYDFTNQATLARWPGYVTAIDVCWGAFATMTATLAATWAARAFAG
ncbi:hypothetical protein AQZ52_09520 [Novosphingobium fuchskuhlense]|uniref:DUF2177 domain-containing protein n=1 Tax=Novosphingobium fuchskuhlense TaxID=1117702 RepID=A0A117UVU0_9SPHN|nr:DUF2177 family protein [Novosphingobium fuchskuhlense]KUR71814.1 hypothetical protein AQZ52_09520 [Novosphingobium fuchskuhlense]